MSTSQTLSSTDGYIKNIYQFALYAGCETSICTLKNGEYTIFEKNILSWF